MTGVRPRVAVIGWGRMGRCMGRRLIERGHAVTVYDVSGEARRDADASEAAVADTPADAASAGDVVLTSLPDAEAVTAAALQEAGLVHGLGAGTIWLEMSSSHPETTRRMSEVARSCSAELLDAPVSGGVVGARNGTLTIMVGGSAEALERARPVLEVLGQRLIHVGSRPGDGDLAKTINNMLSAVNLTAAAEGLALGLKHGLEAGPLLESIAESTGSSHAVKVKIPRYVMTESFDAGFTIRDLLKDLRISQDVAAAGEVPTDVRALVQSLWTAFAAQGHGDDDHTAVVRHVLSRAGVELAPPDEGDAHG